MVAFNPGHTIKTLLIPRGGGGGAKRGGLIREGGLNRAKIIRGGSRHEHVTKINCNNMHVDLGTLYASTNLKKSPSFLTMS